MVWGVNGAKMWLEGYNLATDYESDGTRKKDAVKKYLPFTSARELNAAILVLPPGRYEGDDGTRGVIRWLEEMRLWARDHCE